MAHRISQLPLRISNNPHSFGQEDKFETCLNLLPYINAQRQCLGLETWTQFKALPDRTNWLTDESIADFEENDIDPYTFSQYHVSPLLPARVHEKTFGSKPLQSNVKAGVYRAYTTKVASITKNNLFIQYQHLTSCCVGVLKDKISVGYDVWPKKIDTLPVEVLNAFAMLEDFYSIVNMNKDLHCLVRGETSAIRAAKRSRISGDRKFSTALGGHYIVMRDFVIMYLDKKQWLVPTMYLLETYNKVSEMACLLLYLHLSTGTSMPVNHWSISLRFLRECLAYLTKSRRALPTIQAEYKIAFNDNRGFVVMKTMEALGVGVMSLKEDRDSFDIENHLLLDTMWAALKEDELVTEETAYESKLFQIMMDMETSQISDIIGVVKVFGHPIIDVVGGLQKLDERVHKLLEIDDASLRRCLGLMIKDLVKNFYVRKGVYPILQPESLPELLARLVRGNVDIRSGNGQLHFNRITAEEWAKVQIGKNSEFDMADRQFDLIKDKAIGLTRSEVLKRFLLPITARTRSKPQDRRALLAFLLNPDFSESFQRYLGNYMATADFDDNTMEYLVIKLTAKELELKEAGRYFGASPSEERARRQVQERNVMFMMSQYVPDQLLTVSELESIHKLVAFKKLLQAHPDHVLLHVSADFSAWNNNFRRKTVDESAGKVLDSWFGLRHFFKKTMLAFERMLVYYDDRSYRIYWDGQQGGIEGLNQATWTFLFLAGLKESLDKIGYRYHITVKGDDVRISFLIPKRELSYIGFDGLRTKILEELRDKCGKLGWQLNPNESFVSMTLVCTSKQYIVKDTWLSCAAKKVMKCSAVTNVVFPTLVDHISTVYSVAHAASSQTTVAMPCFVTANYIANRLLVREMRDYKLSLEQYVTLSLWPQILGGPGPLPLQTFLVRGENDMLGCSVSLLRMLDKWITTRFVNHDLNPDEMRRCLWNILDQKLETEPNIRQLLLDPYSVPLAHPERPLTILKRRILEALKLHCQHPDILELLSAEAHDFDEILANNLIAINPCCPKVISAIWECSPTYLITELISKFLQSQTVVSFLMLQGKSKRFRGDRPHTLREMITAHKKQKDYWASTLQKYPFNYDHVFGHYLPEWDNLAICSTQITHLIREKSWNRKLYGITYPSLVDQLRLWVAGDPCMQDVETAESSGHLTRISVRHKTSIPQVGTTSHHYAADESCKAWLGSKTDSRMHFPDWPVELSTEPAHRLLKLLIIMSSERNLDKNIKLLIKQMITTLTNVDPAKVVQLCPPDRDGNFYHRISTHHFSSETMPNYRPNIANLVKINSSQNMTTQVSSHKLTINFAAVHYFLTALAVWPLQSYQNLPDDYPDLLYSCFDFEDLAMRSQGRYQLCNYCCQRIDDIPLQLRGMVSLPTYDLIGISSIRCTSTEDRVLTNAVRQRLTQRIVQPTLVQELVQSMRCTPAQALHTLMQRVKEYTTGVFQSMQQLSISTVPDDQTLTQLCSGMGLEAPKQEKVNLVHLVQSNRDELTKASIVQLFVCYIEVVADTHPIQWSVLAFMRVTEYVQRVLPLLQQLRATKLLHSVITAINHFGSLTGPIPSVPFGAEQLENYAQHIFRVFSSNTLAWLRNMRSVYKPVLSIQARTVEEYNRSANSLITIAQNFSKYLLFIAIGLYEWKSWMSELKTLSNNFQINDTVDAAQLSAFSSRQESLSMLLIVLLSERRWPAEIMDHEELEQYVRDGIPKAVTDSTRHGGGVALPREESQYRSRPAITMFLSTILTEQTTQLELDQCFTTVVEIITSAQDNHLRTDSRAAFGDRIHNTLSLIQWYLNRMIIPETATTLELLAQYHESEMSNPYLDDSTELELMELHQCTNVSMKAQVVVLPAHPGPDSVTKEQHSLHIVHLISEIHNLLKSQSPYRLTGILSGNSCMQHTFFHLMRFTKIHWRDNYNQSIVVVLGDPSGLLSKFILLSNNRLYVMHMSMDALIEGDSIKYVTGVHSNDSPPDLNNLSIQAARRITIMHGDHGDIMSLTALTLFFAHPNFVEFPLHAIYLSLETIHADFQYQCIAQLVTILENTPCRKAPIIFIWNLNSICMKSIILACALGLKTTWEVNGLEYLSTPTLTITTIITNPGAVKVQDMKMPVAMFTALAASINSASYEDVSSQQEIFQSFMCEVHKGMSIKLCQLHQHPMIDNEVRDLCLCQILPRLSSKLYTPALECVQRTISRIHGRQLPGNKLLANLRSFKSVMIQFGVSVGLTYLLGPRPHDRLIASIRIVMEHLIARKVITRESATFIPGQTAFVTRLTKSNHTLRLTSHTIILEVNDDQVDLLEAYTVGLTQAYDIIAAIYTIRSATNLTPEKHRALVENFAPMTKLDDCCISEWSSQLYVALSDIQNVLTQWYRDRLLNVSVSPYDQLGLPEIGITNTPLSTLSYDGSSPDYNPESPDYANMSYRDIRSPDDMSEQITSPP